MTTPIRWSQDVCRAPRLSTRQQHTWRGMLALHFFIAQSSSPRRVGVVKKSAESDVNAADGMKENEEEGGDEEGENETRAERSRKVMATRQQQKPRPSFASLHDVDEQLRGGRCGRQGGRRWKMVTMMRMCTIRKNTDIVSDIICTHTKNRFAPCGH